MRDQFESDAGPLPTKAQYAASRLRTAIQRGEIRPGERIRVEELAAALRMSATPIREAIRMVEAEGLLVNAPHRGIRVTEFSGHDARELYELRVVLEEFATIAAVGRLSDDDVVHLRDLAQRHKRSAGSGDAAAAGEINREWHMRIYSAAHRTPYLVEAISRLWNAFPWPVTWWVPGRDERDSDHHYAIMEAIAARDAERAGRLMREHILAGREFVLDQLSAEEAPHLERDEGQNRAITDI